MDVLSGLDQWLWLLLLDSPADRLALVSTEPGGRYIRRLNLRKGKQKFPHGLFARLCSRVSRDPRVDLCLVRAGWLNDDFRCAGPVLRPTRFAGFSGCSGHPPKREFFCCFSSMGY